MFSVANATLETQLNLYKKRKTTHKHTTANQVYAPLPDASSCLRLPASGTEYLDCLLHLD